MTIGAAAQDAGPAKSRILAPVNDAERITFPGSTHPKLRHAVDAGPVNSALPMKRMLLVLGAAEEQERELGRLLASQHDKSSGSYHQWLTPEDFGRRFGPSPDDLQKISDWLTGQGFVVHQAARSGRWIEFSGTSGQVEHAFRTRMRNYQVDDGLRIANATDISLPAALAPVVKGVSLHGFVSRPHSGRYYIVRRNAEGKFVPVDPDVTVTTANGILHFLTPSDYANIYNLNPLYQAGLDGSGQTIAIVARSNVAMADVETFREIFNLPVNDPKVILTGPDEGNGDIAEATLDAEWAGALAPSATLDLVVSSSTATTDGVTLSAAYIVDNNLAPVMSASFGECEQNLGSENAFFNALWQQAAAQGISVLVSSGDNGAAGCDAPGGGVPASHGQAVNGLASTPFNTAVGGTQFAENGQDATFWNSANVAGFESAAGYIPEAVWNESCDPSQTTCPGNFLSLFSGSGGISTLYAPPSWQTLNIPGLAGQSFSHRVLPDVSLAAAANHDGYLVCLFGSCSTSTDDDFLMQASVFGGTSASSPSMAAIMALIDQKLGGRQGLANYALYQIAANENFTNCNSSNETNPASRSQCVFNDVTSGNNSVPGQVGFNAGVGFDEASGLGSINAASLANAWSALALNSSATSFSATTPTTVAHGQPISFSGAVAAAGGAAGTPSGNVSLISDKFGPVGTAGLTAGTFAGSFSSLPGGQYNLTAHYPGDGAFAPSDSGPVAVNISSESSSLAISAFTNGVLLSGPIVFGQFVALRGTVTSASGQGVATGAVTFSDTFNGTTTPLGSSPLNAQGYAELVSCGFCGDAPINFAIGTHSISASYAGDSSFASSATLSQQAVTVTKGESLVAMQVGSTSVPASEQVLLHIFVKGSTIPPPFPTGSIQLTDNGTALGAPVTIPPSTANQAQQVSIQLSLGQGAHSLEAQYLGDSNFDGSSSGAVTVTVTAPTGTATTTTLVAATNTPVVNQLTNYAVTVTSSSSTPPLTGTVQLINDELGPVTNPVALDHGKALIPFQWAFGGTQKLLALYSGDANYATSASPPLTLNVALATASLTLAASDQNAASGSQISLMATLSAPPFALVFAGSDPNGSVQFFDSVNGGAAQPLGAPVGLFPVHLQVSITEGYKASAVLPVMLANGNHVITAQYLGSCCFLPATSPAVSVAVGQRNTTKSTLAVDATQPAIGQTVHFTVNVSSSQVTPGLTGTVQILSRTLGSLGSAPLVNGSAVIAVPWTAGGFQSVYAEYSGDSSYASSSSNLVTETVPAFELLMSANALPIPAGQGAAAELDVIPVAGYQATTTFSCGAGIPAGATCTFSPSSVTPNGATATSFVIIQTTAPSAAASHLVSSRGNGWWRLSAAAGIACLVLIVLPGRKAYRSISVMLMIVCVGAFVIGCGGGSSAGGPTPTPTPTPAPAAPSTTSLASLSTKVASGDTITLTASVTSSAGSPLTGTVSFLDGATPLGAAVNVASGQAQLQISSLSVGTHAITAKYNGDPKNATSTSAAVNQVVTGTATFQVTASGGNQTRSLTMTVVIE